MKKTISLLSLCLILLMGIDAKAQKINDWLKTKKDEAKTKVNNKVDQKSSAGIDNALNKPEELIKKKKEKNKEKKSKNKEEGSSAKAENDPPSKITAADATSTNMDGEGAQTVIQTNINCEAGKKRIEAALKKNSSVLESKVNIKNGELSVRYDSNGIGYSKLLQLVNDQGFEADGNKPIAGTPANPCKK